jgi:hypothetical protein
MAGSYRHITNSDGSFRGVEQLDNMNDAYEALKECYDMIRWLSGGGDRDRIAAAWFHGHFRRVNPRANVRFERKFWDDE